MPSDASPSSYPDTFPEWKAPGEDGALLVWPPPGQLLSQTRDNHSHLAAQNHVTIQNASLPALRSRTRHSRGYADDRLLIATGHQTELHHPGVWAKNILLNVAAPKLDADALHLAVDTDAPKHLVVRWPGEHRPQSEPLSDDADLGQAAWSGLLRPPSDRWLSFLSESTLSDPSLRYDHGEPSMLPEFWPLMRAASKESKSLDAALSTAMARMDASIGLKYQTVIASKLWAGEGFLTFAHHILARARQFSTVYNESLADYRKRTGIKSAMRPMPDLFTGHGSVEAPFWLDDRTAKTRLRPSVFDTGDGFRLELVNGEQFHFDPTLPADEAARQFGEFLTSTNHQLSPRALTLTMFMRLLLVDQFVHGIGGGRYDQVTDEIIRRFFNLKPPAFSVTTATLIYPGVAGRDRVCLPCLRSEGHRLKHHVLGERSKKDWLAKIDALPRNSVARREAFAEFQRARNNAVRDSDIVKDWHHRLESGHLRYEREKTLFDRELFYGVQTRHRLESLIEKYTADFA